MKKSIGLYLKVAVLVNLEASQLKVPYLKWLVWMLHLTFSGSSWFGSEGKTYRSSQWFSKFLPFWADCCKDCGLVSRASCCRGGDLTVYGLAIFHLCIWYSVALQDIFSHNLVSKGSPLSWSYRFYQTGYLGVMKDMKKREFCEHSTFSKKSHQCSSNIVWNKALKFTNRRVASRSEAGQATSSNRRIYSFLSLLEGFSVINPHWVIDSKETGC